MDVNVNSEIKGVGLTVAAPAVERADRLKSPVTPVAAGTDSTPGALGDKELHRRDGRQKQDGGQKQNDASTEDLGKVVEEIQKRLDAMGTRLNFAINKEPDAVVVKVTDRESGELVRQIPSEEVLALREKLQELSGLLFDEKV